MRSWFWSTLWYIVEEVQMCNCLKRIQIYNDIHTEVKQQQQQEQQYIELFFFRFYIKRSQQIMSILLF